MSYDFSARIDTGGPYPHYIEPSFDDTHPGLATNGVEGSTVAFYPEGGYTRIGNYTSNVSPIWARCLTKAALSIRYPKHLPDGDMWLSDIDGERLGDITTLLHAAVEYGIDHLEDLRELEPENRWGNAEGAITYLWDIQRFSEMHPNAFLSLNR
jgi:hypothetical protein